MKTNKTIISIAAILAVLLAGLAAVPSAQAAVITWQTPTVILGDSDVSTTGTLNRAYNLTTSPYDPVYGTPPASNPTVVNGVSFEGWVVGYYDKPDTTRTTVPSIANTSGNGSPSAPFSNLSSGYQALLDTSCYATGNITFTLQNLTSGQDYLFQGWVNDSRGSYYSRTEYLSGGGANSDTFHIESSSTAGSLGYYVIGTFLADSTNQAITVQGVNLNIAQLNAFQLRAIPEPATWALLAFSLTSVMVLRRRRA